MTTMHRLTLDSLLTLERAGWDSLCDQTGGSFYGGLMIDDALTVLVNGMTVNRDTVVASLGESPAWDAYEIREPRIVTMGPEVAALVYRATAQRAGEPLFEALMSSTYVLVDGQTRLALYQQTTVTH